MIQRSRRVFFFIAVVVLVGETGGWSQSPVIPSPDASATLPASRSPKKYSVWIWQDNGDCLWRIAEKVYGDRSKWRLIYLANRDVIKDPNKIYPNQTLKIPPVDWNPDGH